MPDLNTLSLFAPSRPHQWCHWTFAPTNPKGRLGPIPCFRAWGEVKQILLVTKAIWVWGIHLRREQMTCKGDREYGNRWKETKWGAKFISNVRVENTKNFIMKLTTRFHIYPIILFRAPRPDCRDPVWVCAPSLVSLFDQWDPILLCLLPPSALHSYQILPK